jgi:hypothetical protein
MARMKLQTLLRSIPTSFIPLGVDDKQQGRSIGALNKLLYLCVHV